MPTASVDNHGTVLYYEDSGAPPSPAYITVVLLHGLLINGGIFTRLFRYAEANNLRLLAVNLRDYAGSTPYSRAEIEVLQSSNKDAQATCLETQGLQLATFIRWFIGTKNIPPITRDPKSGDALGGGFALYHPILDESLDIDGRASHFTSWVSYYNSPPKVEPGSPGFVSALLECKPLHEGSEAVPPEASRRLTPTVWRMSPDELSATTDCSLLARSQLWLLLINADIFKANLRHALFDCPLNTTGRTPQIVWPDVKVRVVWGDMSTSDCLAAIHILTQLCEEYRGSVHIGRNPEFIRLQGVNHFVSKDSGPPVQSTTYTTVVLAHGTMFHGAIMRPLLPYVAEHNLRLVFLNLRDYPGSTRYSPSEIDALRGPGRESQEAAIQARGLEFAAFLHWFIETQHIPPISEPGDGMRTGGISILFWSSGNAQGLSMLAHADVVPEKTRRVLGMYLRTVVLHDVSLSSIGAEVLDGLGNPLRGPSSGVTSYEDMVRRFTTWISSYWTQVDLSPASPAFAAVLVARRPMHALDTSGGRGGDADPWTPSTLRMSTDEFETTADIEVVRRSQYLYQRIDASILQENLRRALSHCYVDEEAQRRPVLPALRVRVVWCDMSGGEEVWAAANIKRQLFELHDARDVEVFRLEKANHFVLRDEPERFMQFLAGTV
ncbi:hypothetical protein B0H21DRAFT_687756 [Amylocystis lapponica]|nr:hypothetical protein B0H21DRAFT_687756 [Amylocystis lapponica]